jgi:Raf kinase inhibitor-like YbhB/YbcL family protein
MARFSFQFPFIESCQMLEKLPEAVGHVLRKQRAGVDELAFNRLYLRSGMAAIEVSSVAFADQTPIPARYTADGEGLSPPLQWHGVPAAAGSVLLIVEDADAPAPRPLVHAIAVDLPASRAGLAEGELNSTDARGNIHAGRNSYLMSGWLPPDPPPGHGLHRYAFQVFALLPGEPFSGKPGRQEVLAALSERAVARGCLIGTYERRDGSAPAAG